MTVDEFERFKSAVGVYQEGKNYNVIIDGHGTGLRPPTEKQLRELKDRRFLVEIKPSYDAPSAYDNSETDWFPPIGDQGLQGSCVTWACGYYTKTFQEAKEHGWDLSGCWFSEVSGPSWEFRDYIFSPAFIYNQINGGVDEGSYYSDAMDLLYRIGCCTWRKLPYDDINYTDWADEEGWRQAVLYRSLNGFNVMDVSTSEGIEALKEFVSSGNLGVISVNADYYLLMETNDLWTADIYGPIATNHANTIVGYDDSFGPYTEFGNPNTYGAFKVANSWGKGDWENEADGFLYISYECMKQRIMYVYFYENRLDYNPQMISVFSLNHNVRGDCQVSLGIGNPEAPIATISFDDYNLNGGDHPYPFNNMVLDITEFVPYLTESGDTLFLSVYDRDPLEGYSALTGRIDHFAVEIYDDYLSGDPICSLVSGDDFPISTINRHSVFSLIIDQRLIEVSPTETLVSWETGDYTFDVQCYSLGSLNWEATILEGRDWISFVSDTSDSVSGSFAVHCEENTDVLNDRVGIIQIQSSEAENGPVDITITQSKATYLLNVDPLTANVTYLEGDVYFDILVDGPDTLSWVSSVLGGESWLQIVSGSTGQGDGTVAVHYDVNIDPYLLRRDTIRIESARAANAPVDLVVNQSEAVYTISVSPGNLVLAWQSGDSVLQVFVEGPVSPDWNISIVEGDSWLNLISGQNGNGSGEIGISCEANMDPDHDRVAELQVDFGEPINDSRSVSITQHAWEEFDRISTGQIVNDEMLSQGISWADYDGDGDQDIFVTHGSGMMQRNNILYDNRNDGSFTKITMQSGSSFGSSWGDYDNDGDLDLFVANMGNNYLYRNKGNKEFEIITNTIVVQDGGSSRGCGWGDFDNDGLLDLFVANCENEMNFLYWNMGNGSFQKVTSGAIVNDVGDSRGCSWGDYDNDGYLDLFVANYNNQNNFLYHNNGDGNFTRVTSGDVVNDGGKSQGCSWGDYNNDGYLDLYVTNRPDQNNFLYYNNGDGTFNRITTGAIVTDKGTSFGSSWGDYDNDGVLDLFVANHSGQNNFLYRNHGDGTFVKISSKKVVEDNGDSYGTGWGNCDNDGDIDLFVANYDQANFFYSNNACQNHWVNIRCVGTVSNASAIGARVKIKATISGQPVWQMQEVSGQTGYLSQNSLNCEFGLGDAISVDSIQIFWPSGISWDSTEIAVDQFVVIKEWAHRPIAGNDQAVTLITDPIVINVLDNDMDEDGDQLTIQSIDTTGTIGTVMIDPGDTTVTYTPDSIFIGIDHFYYIVSDGLCGRDTGEVVIEVNPIPNTPPVACDDQTTTVEDVAVVINVLDNDTDPDEDPLTIQSIDTLSTRGDVAINSGNAALTYTPHTGYVGTDSLHYVISDGRGGLDTARVTVQITAKPNNRPIAANDSISVYEGTTVMISILDNDEDTDSDPLFIQSLDTTATAGLVSIQSGDTIVVYSAPSGFEGVDVFGYVVSDGEGGLDTANVIVEVMALSGLANGPKIPRVYSISQNFPNPFNPKTEVRYQLPKSGDVRIVIYSVVGKEVKTIFHQQQPAGYHSIQWDGKNDSGYNVPSGIYLLLMEADSYRAVRKMMLLR